MHTPYRTTSDSDLSRFNEIKRVLMSGLNRFLIISELFFEVANLHASEYRLSVTYAISSYYMTHILGTGLKLLVPNQ